MFIYIPGWLVSILTFPGIVFHEIAHRFFCDIYNIPVFKIVYLSPFSDEHSGCVVHAQTKRFKHVFFISTAPLLFNSLIFMLCTFPFGIKVCLGSYGIFWENSLVEIAYFFITWIGLCASIHLFPSEKDMSHLHNIQTPKNSHFSTIFAILIIKYINLMNFPLLGIIPRLIYLCFLFFFLPTIYLLM
jgi:hypothetical protein